MAKSGPGAVTTSLNVPTSVVEASWGVLRLEKEQLQQILSEEEGVLECERTLSDVFRIEEGDAIHPAKTPTG